MSIIDRLRGRGRESDESSEAEPPRRWVVGPGDGRPGLEVILFVGELTEAPAEVLCTSTNPRLSLLGGTGRAVVGEGGWSIKREAADVLAAERRRTGRDTLEVGTVSVTSAGALPFERILHCVASDDRHRSSPEAIRRCVEAALRSAEEIGATSVAMPIFGAGHASFSFSGAVREIAEALRRTDTAVERVVLVIFHPHRAEEAEAIVDEVLGPRAVGSG